MSEMNDSGGGGEATEAASRGSAGGQTAAEPGEGKPAGRPASDGYYIGGPEVEKDIAIQEQKTGTEVANSGGSGEAEATSGKAGGESKASGDGKAGAGQDAKTESTAKAVGGSAAGADRGVPGEGEPADAWDSSDTGEPEVEPTLAQEFAEKAAAYARENPDVIIKTINVLSWACSVYPAVEAIIEQGTEIRTEGVQECLESAKMFLENLPGIRVRHEFQQNKDDMFR
jgi:hypothetical protein